MSTPTQPKPAPPEITPEQLHAELNEIQKLTALRVALTVPERAGLDASFARIRAALPKPEASAANGLTPSPRRRRK